MRERGSVFFSAENQLNTLKYRNNEKQGKGDDDHVIMGSDKMMLQCV